MIKKILMIDNDLDFIEACRNFLEATGYEVESEHREEHAVGKILSFRPDLILLDVVMDTEKSGFDIADTIQAREELKDTPVVFLTGYFKKTGLLDQQNDIFSRWKNVKQVLDKPVKPAILLDIVKKISENKL